MKRLCPRTLWCCVLVSAALLPAALFLSDAGRAAIFDPAKAVGIDHQSGAQIPLDMGFLDEQGRRVTLGELGGGKPILLVPVVHRCPNICGVTLAGLVQAIAGQKLRPGRDFAIIAFGIDPAEGPYDAAASLAPLRARFPWLGRGLAGVTGSPADVALVTHRLGYRYAWDKESRQYVHLAATAVLTSTGRLSRWLYGVAPGADDLSLAVTEAGEGQVGSWADQLLLLCYHYDPVNGRYDNIAWTAVQFGGCLLIASAAVVMLGTQWRAWRRARRDAQQDITGSTIRAAGNEAAVISSGTYRAGESRSGMTHPGSGEHG